MVVAAFTLLLSGCVQGENGPAQTTVRHRAVGESSSTVLTSFDELNVFSGDMINLDLQAGPWGVLRLVAQQNLTINVTVTNPAFNVSTERPAAANQAYDAHNHTHVYLFGEDEFPHAGAGFAMEWWGHPRNGPIPNLAASPQPVRPGTAALLVVATTVAGYSVHISAGPNVATFDYAWRLGPNKDYHFASPAASVKSTATNDAARVQRDIDWTTGRLAFAPGILRAFAWTSNTQQPARAGMAEDRLAIEAVRSAPPSGAPQTPLQGGSSYYYAAMNLQAPGEYEMYRHIKDSNVGLDTTTVGASFLAIPFH